MKRKRTAAMLLALVLAAVLQVSAGAKTWAASDFTLAVPEEFVYTFDQTTPEDDPAWALAGVGDPAAVLSGYREMNVIASFYTEDGQTNVMVMTKESASSQSIYHLKDLPEEEREKFLSGLDPEQEGISVETEFREYGGLPFYWVKTDNQEGSTPVHGVLCGTILNGRAVTLELYNGDREVTEEQMTLFESLAGSFVPTQILEKPVPKISDYIPTLVMLALLLIAIIAPLVYVPLRGRLEKKRKAKMAERLSQFHKDHPGNTLAGELRFANSTECTKEAIHAFSVYQAYGKRLASLLLGIFLCALLLVVAFSLDLAWWLKVCAVGVSGYTVYRIFSMPNTIEKIQMKVFRRGTSPVAHYAFYDEGFRVSGIQSGSVYAYFQITDVRKRGQYLYLYYGPENAYLIDGYGFETGDLEGFEKFIRQKTGKGK